MLCSNAGIMMQELAAGAFHEGFELGHLMRPATDVKHLGAAKLWRQRALLLAQPAGDLCFHERQFAVQSFAFAFGLLPHVFGLRHRQGCRLKAAFEALAARHLPIETAVKVDQRRLCGAHVIIRVGR